MKKLLLLCFILLSGINGFAQCPTTNIVLSTQAEVEAFVATYPGCTELTTMLRISGTDISDLSPLSVITSLGFNLTIENNPILQNLNGLENVVSFGISSEANLSIINNPQLASISSLTNMNAPVNGNNPVDLNVKDNPLLLSLDGLQGITGFTYDFVIDNNDSLVNFVGIENVTGADNFIIINNDGLINLSGFNNFKNAGEFRIENNSSLQTLEDVTIENIMAQFRVNNNIALNNINVFYPWLTYTFCDVIIEITNNPNLSTCNNDYICNIWDCVGSDVTINNNDIGCNSIPEATVGCPDCPTDSIELTTQAEVDTFASTYPNCTNFHYEIKVSGPDITNLSGLNQMEAMFSYFTIMDNPNLVSLTGLENLSYIGQTTRIVNNPLLVNLQGLNSLEGRSIYVSGNDAMSSFDGLDSLESLNSLSIFNNNSLVDISILENATNVSQNLSVSISNNANLSQCSLSIFCELINAGQGSFQISNNGVGCETYDDVYEDCTGCPYDYVGLLSQAEVDNFIIEFPTCTQIDDLFISGSDIVDLTPLQNLVTANIAINNNPLLTSLDGLQNLENSNKIILQNNPSLVDVSALGNISSVYTVDVSWNSQLTEIVGWDSLIETNNLMISNNALLTSLIGLQNLEVHEGIQILDNFSLPNLNGLQGITSPIYLVIDGNDNLTDITALGNIQSNLNEIIIKLNESLINLDGLEGVENILYVVINSNSSLENLDGLSGLSNLGGGAFTEIEIKFNDNLSDISGLEFIDPSSILEVIVDNNPNLSECSILSFCEAISIGNADLHFNFNGIGCNSTEEVGVNCDISLNTISGNILFDFDNSNNCDANDYPASNLLVTATNTSSQISSAFTNDLGEYELRVPEGEFTIQIESESFNNNYTSNPETVVLNFTSTGNQDTADFCISAITVYNDLKITLFSIGQARPGFNASYRLIFENIGTTVISGDVTLDFDASRQTFLNATPTEDNISGNTITWNFTDLLPFESRTIDVLFNTLPPPTNDSGDILSFEATINPISGDENPIDNVYNLEQTIVNSQDPNDKQVMQGEEIYEDEVGEYLDYIVRFQNVGTAAAINVRVDDLLSDNLDWNTFRILSSSHNYRVEIANENEVSFLFEGIYLPPESTDSEGSNGFITFQIKTKSDLNVGDSVENFANIYFDFNAAIVTNTVVTTVVENLGVSDVDLKNSVSLIPNPVSEILTISVSENVLIQNVAVYSVLGNKLLETSEGKVDFSAYSSGVYFVKVRTNQGDIYKKVIKE